MKATRFAEVYGYEYNTVYVHKNKQNPHVYVDGKTVMVDEKALEKRRVFLEKIHEKAQEAYFTITDTMPEMKLAKLLSIEFGGTYNTWLMFMRKTLFSTAYQDKTLLAYKITGKMWKFWRFTRQYLRDRK